MKNIRIIALFCFITLLIGSCNQEKQKMIQGLSGIYVVNFNSSDKKLLERLNTTHIYLVLESDKDFRIVSDKYNCISAIRGKWDLTDDLEHSNYIFKLNNGEIQKTGTLGIKVKCGSLKGYVYFKRK